MCGVHYALDRVIHEVPGALYFAVFLTASAVGPLIGTTITWAGNTWGNHCKRESATTTLHTDSYIDKKAVAMGLVFSAGNSGGIVSSEAYQNKDAPRLVSQKPSLLLLLTRTRFTPGHAAALAFCALNCITAGDPYGVVPPRESSVVTSSTDRHRLHTRDTCMRIMNNGASGVWRE